MFVLYIVNENDSQLDFGKLLNLKKYIKRGTLKHAINASNAIVLRLLSNNQRYFISLYYYTFHSTSGNKYAG